MFSMILQLGGVGNLIVGIIAAVAGANISHEKSNGKLKFWYQ